MTWRGERNHHNARGVQIKTMNHFCGWEVILQSADQALLIQRMLAGHAQE